MYFAKSSEIQNNNTLPPSGVRTGGQGALAFTFSKNLILVPTLFDIYTML